MRFQLNVMRHPFFERNNSICSFIRVEGAKNKFYLSVKCFHAHIRHHMDSSELATNTHLLNQGVSGICKTELFFWMKTVKLWITDLRRTKNESTSIPEHMKMADSLISENANWILHYYLLMLAAHCSANHIKLKTQVFLMDFQRMITILRSNQFALHLDHSIITNNWERIELSVASRIW